MLSKDQQQHILNEAYRHCVKQGRPAMVEGGCAYLADGDRCAIGAGMSEPTIKRLGDSGASVNALVLYDSLRCLFGCAVDSDDIRFLVDIQAMHDQAWDQDFVAGVRSRARGVAKWHGLTLPKDPE